MKGYCQCKEITYEIEGEPRIESSYCHCDTCQRETGSSYNLYVAVPKDKVKIEGNVKKYFTKADSGNMLERWFCGNCRSSIASPSAETLYIVGGTLSTEDKKTLDPTIEIFTQTKLPFIKETLAQSFHGSPE